MARWALGENRAESSDDLDDSGRDQMISSWVISTELE